MRELEDLRALEEEVEEIDIEEVWRAYSKNVQPDLEKNRLTREGSRDLRYSIYLTAA